MYLYLGGGFGGDHGVDRVGQTSVDLIYSDHYATSATDRRWKDLLIRLLFLRHRKIAWDDYQCLTVSLDQSEDVSIV